MTNLNHNCIVTYKLHDYKCGLMFRLTNIIPAKIRAMPHHWLRSMRSRRKIQDEKHRDCAVERHEDADDRHMAGDHAGVVGDEGGSVHQAGDEQKPPDIAARQRQGAAGRKAN